MLELRDVSKTYNGVTALEPTKLLLSAGGTTALLGPSGCGKSTLLRIIVGLIEPDGGEVYFDGERVTAANLLELRHRMGYMIQDGGLFPHLSLQGNITLLARFLKRDSARIQARLNELADLVHLPMDALQRFPSEVSGGQRQRVALMRALFLNPDVLLLDEPLGALDPLIRSDLQSDLREIFRRLNKTVVVVTHDIGEAGYLADTIVLLKDGRIIQQGSLDQLVREPAEPFVTSFVNAQRSPLDAVGPPVNDGDGRD